jgi:hypothetical protein
MFWKKKKKTVEEARKEPTLAELFETYNKRVYLREEQRYEMVREATQLEQRRRQGKEYIK